MKPLVFASAVLCACSASTTAAPVAPEAERDAIVATVNDMFAAMREHQVDALRELVAEGAIIVRLGTDDSGATRHQVIAAEDFITGTAGDSSVTIDERFTAPPVVQYDGEMATLWGPYDVRVNGEFKHCGVDAVQLAKLDGRWKVTAITYTGRSQGC